MAAEVGNIVGIVKYGKIASTLFVVASIMQNSKIGRPTSTSNSVLSLIGLKLTSLFYPLH